VLLRDLLHSEFEHKLISFIVGFRFKTAFRIVPAVAPQIARVVLYSSCFNSGLNNKFCSI